MAKGANKQRIVKYIKAKAEGKTKEEAKNEAGFAPSTTPYSIEKSEVYQEVAPKFSDELLKQLSVKDIVSALAENILQDKDRGARNKAIEMAKDWIEPEDKGGDKEEQIIIVMAGQASPIKLKSPN